MTNYHSPTVVVPNIPVVDVHDNERLLLNLVFQHEICPDKPDDVYFFAEDQLNLFLTLKPQEWVQINTLLVEMGEPEVIGTDTIEFDVSFIAKVFQRIIKRSQTVDRVEIITSYTCDKMRPDGFGGGIVVITAEAVESFSTANHERVNRPHLNQPSKYVDFLTTAVRPVLSSGDQ